jgi:hypothetical protein
MSLGEAKRTEKRRASPTRVIQQQGWSASIALNHSPKSLPYPLQWHPGAASACLPYSLREQRALTEMMRDIASS